MKSTRFLIIFILFINMQLSAQVFTRADFAYANQWYTYQMDTTPSSKIKFRFTGPSNTWNFTTGLKNQRIDSILFEDTINYSNKPLGCNLVQVSNEAINYIKVDASGVLAFLDLGDFTDTISTIKNLIKQYPFPLSYLSELKDSLSASTIQSVSELGLDNPLYDSLKTDIKVFFHSFVDASGQLLTPKGTYEQTLRVRNTQQPVYLFFGRNKTSGIYEPLNIPIPGGNNLVNTDTTYTWWVFKKGYYVAQAIVNKELLSLSYLVNSSQGAASIPNIQSSHINVFPNPSSGLLVIDQGNYLFEKYSIINSLGQKVQEASFSSIVDVSNLPDGLYFLSLNTHNEGSFTKAFVRSH
jgi:hypothetical protein